MAVRELKCCECGLLLPKYSLDRVDYNGKHYCKNCLVKYLTNRNRGRMSQEDAERYILPYIHKRKELVASQILRDNFYNWLQDKYEFEIIPSRVFTYISQIENGEYKNMQHKISLAELSEMWYIKEDNMRAYDTQKGIYGQDRIYYDLTVLVAHYPDYIRYKEQMRSVENEYVKTVKGINNFMKANNRYDNVHDNGDDGVADLLRELEGD